MVDVGTAMTDLSNQRSIGERILIQPIISHISSLWRGPVSGQKDSSKKPDSVPAISVAQNMGALANAV